MSIFCLILNSWGRKEKHNGYFLIFSKSAEKAMHAIIMKLFEFLKSAWRFHFSQSDCSVTFLRLSLKGFTIVGLESLSNFHAKLWYPISFIVFISFSTNVWIALRLDWCTLWWVFIFAFFESCLIIHREICSWKI